MKYEIDETLRRLRLIGETPEEGRLLYKMHLELTKLAGTDGYFLTNAGGSIQKFVDYRIL